MTTLDAGSAPRARGTLLAVRAAVRARRISPACAGNTLAFAARMTPITDQPRVRGEHLVHGGRADDRGGSAPRARGTPPDDLSALDACRISPACAGNTAASGLRVFAPPGSAPRARGTPTSTDPDRSCQRISPACAGNTLPRADPRRNRPDQPRVRGEHLLVGVLLRLHDRISPACAGNTLPQVDDSGHQADQPRVRGEHTLSPASAASSSGSAPRARGTPRNCRSMTWARPDQPRVRGEHRSRHRVLRILHGSAPRARGTHRNGERDTHETRISPACAGNTPAPTGTALRPADQPRVRGEHVSGQRNQSASSGSAPRARGTPKSTVMRDAAPRISPACAGNTSGSRNRPGWKADQPRVRGEHLVALGAGAGISGSAPRARGTPKTPGCPTAKRRISPACAGNTERRYPRERCTKDQPRVRGEHGAALPQGTVHQGSAPRARGTP